MRRRKYPKPTIRNFEIPHDPFFLELPTIFVHQYPQIIEEYAPCPKCSHTGASKVYFTWWGLGGIAHRWFTHVKCENCSTKYNGKTGKLNTKAIAIYLIVNLVGAAAVAYFIWR